MKFGTGILYRNVYSGHEFGENWLTEVILYVRT